jgi:hypothetical protein
VTLLSAAARVTSTRGAEPDTADRIGLGVLGLRDAAARLGVSGDV